jgi:outer membrane protein TolC
MPATRLALAACMLTLAGCASYHARPLSADATARALEARSLADPRLAAFIGAAAGPGAVAGRWDLASLTLAALYFHPDLDVARTQVALARAGLEQARARPNPSLSFEDLSVAATSPVQYTIAPLINFLIETGGKREARTREAQAQVDAARLRLLSHSWEVRAGVRAALLDLWRGEQRQELLQQELALQEELTDLLDHRLAVGEASSLEVARERTREGQARLALLEAQSQIETARGRLAAAVGVPRAGLDGAAITFTSFDSPPVQTPADEGELRRAALTGRSDVQELLAQYAAAEAALALQIAGAKPDVTLGPGYSFDSAQNRYLLLPALELPVNGNHAAIAVARARREETAARFTALQARIVAALDDAQVAYRAAGRELTTAESLLAGESERERQTDRAFEAGAVDRPGRVAVQLERNAAAQAHLDALVRQRSALGSLEDALQRPLLGPELPALSTLEHGQGAP